MGKANGASGEVSDLTGRIYDAAVDPELWPDAIAHIVEAAGCRSGVFYEHDIASHQSRPLGYHRFNPEFMRDYEAYYGALDPWNKCIMAWPVGVAAPTYALMPDDEFRRTEFYQDHLRLTGVFYGLGGVVERSRDRMAVFGVQCSYEDGRFSTAALDLIGGLMPHLRRAYRMHSALGRARRERETLEDVLHLMEKPVLIVEPDGKLVFANHAADVLLRHADGLRLTAGCVRAAHRGDQAELERVLRPDSAPGSGAIALRRRRRSGTASAAPLLVQAVPLQRAGRPTWSGRMALLIETPETGRPVLDELASAFHLSAAETRLWTGLATGHRLADIAEETAVSVNTLRVHLAHLFRKVGVHRQADLVRLAAELHRTHAAE